MKQLSTSLTLGKASAGNANLAHNSREFISSNVDTARICDNITYVSKDVREVYNELFTDSLAEYNSRQKRTDRRIDDYFEHIDSGGREESFYEIIVQFGDMKSAGVGTQTGEMARRMVDDYVRSFQARNPNLRVFSAHLHADEASYHAHIDFVPFYTGGRQKGLSKGVSLKAALIEQGFSPTSMKQNQLVAWEDSEMKIMEKILQSHGYNSEEKNANHQQQTVAEYKKAQDEKKLSATKWERTLPEKLELQNALLISSNAKLLAEKQSPWKSFFFSDKAGLDFILGEIRLRNIPIRETESGFEAQEIHVEEIRRIEKSYQPTPTSYRSKLIDDLDRIVMQVNTFDEVFERLKQINYTIKLGKYISVRPEYADKFIRFNSLGEEYSEQAIRNRLVHKARFEAEVESNIQATKTGTLTYMVHKTVRQYTVVFAHGVLPVRKRNPKKPFQWTNCTELDRLAELNRRINSGATIESLRSEFATLEKAVAEKENAVTALKSELDFFSRLYNAGERCFKFMQEDEADLAFLAQNKVTADNYERITELITENTSEITQLEQSLPELRQRLKEATDTLTLAEKIMAGTWVQSLINEERLVQQAKYYVENGTRYADAEPLISGQSRRK